MFKAKTFTFDTDNVTVLFAAAGAGKTTALVNMVTELLRTYRPDEIAFVTFTKKGVENGIERVLRANPDLTAEELPYFRTLHALCFRELGLKKRNMLERRDLRAFSAALSPTFNTHIYGRDSYEKQTGDDQLLSRYDAVRSGADLRDFIQKPYDLERYNILIRAYEAFKEAHKLVDFHDCLLRFKEAGKPVAVKAALIDEAQDLTELQWEVCRVAFSRCDRIMISGDDYQAIFSHSGANPQVLIELSKRYPTIKLEKSYRLPREVYRFAKEIVGVIGQKVEKDFEPVKQAEGFVETIRNHDELVYRIAHDLEKNGTLPGRWYLLFRNNHFIAGVADELEKAVIPYHTAKGFVVPARELSKIRRYYNCRKQGFGSDEAVERFRAEYGITDFDDDFTTSNLIPGVRRFIYYRYVQKHGIEALEAMAEAEPCVLLSTVHKVKGGEADYVAMFMDVTRKVAANERQNQDEEYRVLYVAFTRARMGLFVVQSTGTAYGLDRIVEFVRERIA